MIKVFCAIVKIIVHLLGLYIKIFVEVDIHKCFIFLLELIYFLDYDDMSVNNLAGILC